MKNYSHLFRKVSNWLKPRASSGQESLLFIHIFCHKTTPYHFEESDGWMAQNFFTGGTMPCHDLFLHFQQDVVLKQMWWCVFPTSPLSLPPYPSPRADICPLHPLLPLKG